MKKLILATIFSFALTACGNNTTPSSTNITAQNVSSVDSKMNIAADSTTTSAITKDMIKKGGMGFKKGGRGGFGGGFGLSLAGITLTEDQKTQLKALADADRATFEANKPVAPIQGEKPDFAKMQAAQKALQDAFIADGLTKENLRALIAATRPVKTNTVKPDNTARLDAMANRIIKTYNILTAEQKQQLSDLQAQREAKMAEAKSNVNADANKAKFEEAQTKRFDDLATKLSLNDAQKEAFKALTQHEVKTDVTKVTRTNPMAEIQAQLKAGTATVDSIKALLTPVKPVVDEAARAAKEETRLDNIIKLHDLLSSDQRTKAVAYVFGHGGFGGHGGKMMGKGHGGFGGHRGFPGGPKGGRTAPSPTTGTSN